MRQYLSLSYPGKENYQKRFEGGNVEPEFCSDFKQHFRKQYFEAIDLIVNSIYHWKI